MSFIGHFKRVTLAPASCIALAVALFFGPAHAAEAFRFDVQRPDPKIKGMLIESKPIELDVTEAAPSVYRFELVIEGSFKEEEAALLQGTQKIETQPGSGRFALKVEVRGPMTPIRILAVDPLGAITEEELLLKARDWNGIFQTLSQEYEKTLAFRTGIAAAYLDYSESGKSGIGSFSQISISGTADLSKTFMDRKWYLQGGLYGTLLPTSTSIQGTSMRYLGANARVGVKTWEISPDSVLWTQVGWTYITTFSTGETLGFKNLLSPQINPVLTRRLGPRATLNGYFKLAPLYSLSLNERELAGGVSVGWRTIKGTRMGMGVDYSDIRLYPTGESDSEIRSRTWVIGFSMGFSQ